jgi:hypothetical protein
MLNQVNSARRIHSVSIPLFNEGVPTIDQIYRENLRTLVAEAGGTQEALGAKIQKSPAQISQWLNASKDSKTGKPRTMSRATAREIERRCGKPEGWMDQHHGESAVEDAFIELASKRGIQVERLKPSDDRVPRWLRHHGSGRYTPDLILFFADKTMLVEVKANAETPRTQQLLELAEEHSDTFAVFIADPGAPNMGADEFLTRIGAVPAANDATAPPASPGQRFDAVTDEEHELLENWRWLTGRKKKELFAHIAQLAAERIEELAELYSQHPELEKMGLRAVPRSASARAAIATARASVAPASESERRQQSLLDDENNNAKKDHW